MKNLILLLVIGSAMVARAEYRMVLGKVYNYDDTNLWTTLQCNYQVIQCKGDNVICAEWYAGNVPDANGVFPKNNRVAGSKINYSYARHYTGRFVEFVNYPNPHQVKSQEDLKPPMKPMRVMRTGMEDVWTTTMPAAFFVVQNGHAIKHEDVRGYNFPCVIYDLGKPYVLPAHPSVPGKNAASKPAAEKKPDDEFQQLLSKATKGNPSAQLGLGLRYFAGDGCETNRDKAIYWLQRSAGQGNAEASNKLDELKH